MTGVYETVRVQRQDTVALVEMVRAEAGNTLTRGMIAELHAALDACEADMGVRIIALAGSGGVFCDGMDFGEASGTQADGQAGIEAAITPFFDLLRRFTRSPKWVVAMVDGRVNAGGIGLVAAADHVLATPRSSFGLSEIMFGLLPATVAPFLIRRCGFQPAYRMSLLAQRIDAAQGREMRLVDEVVAGLDDGLRQLRLRIDRIRPGTLADGKSYFGELWPITDETRRRAVGQIARMIADPETLAGIRGFLEGGDVPWRKPSG